MEREALKLALEALEESIDTVRHNYEADWRHGYPTRKAQLNSMKQGVEDHEHAITAIKAALAQPAQEPVARVLQIIKELRPAIKPLEGMGKGKTTEEWFDVLEQALKEMNNG